MPSLLSGIVLLAALTCCFIACGDKARDAGGKTSDTSARSTAPADTAPTPTASGGENYCRLLTAQEISEILGVKVAEGIASEAGCTYDPVSPSLTSVALAKINDRAGYDMLTKGWEPVMGIGDRAAWKGGGLGVMKGGKGVLITVIDPRGVVQTKEPLVIMAEKIVPRL